MGLATYVAASIVLAAALGTACATERHEPFDGDPAFRMSQPSRLFFDNVRAVAYYRERPRGTELDLYRLKAIPQTTRRPILVPLIVTAILKDEAYVFVKPNDYPGLGEPLVVRMRAAGPGAPADRGEFDAGDGTRPAQRALADSLRAALLRGDSLAVRLGDGTWAPVLDDRMDRTHFLTVLGDYDRLIDR